MSLLQQFLIGVRFVGLRAVLRMILNSLLKKNIERRFGGATRNGSDEMIRPEKMAEVTPFHAGATFLFNDDIRLEVTFLSASTVRVTWQPGRLPVEFAVESELTVALQVDVEQKGEAWSLSAGELAVTVDPDGIIHYSVEGEVFREDAPPVYQSPGWDHSAKLGENAFVFGLGERSRYNLRPGRYRMWNNDIGGSYGPGADPLYLTIPVYYCRQETGSYLIFYENSHDGHIAFDRQAKASFSGGALRLYVMSGSLPKTLEEYTRLTGRAPLPPLWSLGYHQCRWGYKSEADIRRVVNGFNEHELPLDVVHLDIDYMDGYRVFTVNRENFPDFKAMADELGADGVKLVTILDPGVKIDPEYEVYNSGLEQDVFLKLPDGKPLRGLVWPGWVHFPDFSKPETRVWWGEFYSLLVEAGVDGFWHDMNEPASFSAFGEKTLPRVTRHHLEGKEGTHEEAHNLYGGQMNRAGYEALQKINPEKRPWILTRSGWAGSQRYAWKWTGDVESTWPALKMTVGTVLGTGISGFPYTGSDIGGFSGSPDAELFTRWFQMSAFMALFRNHTATGAPLREPWVYGEPTTSICREFLNIRRSLMPYLYSLAWQAHLSGAPLARPLSWVDEEDQRLWEVDDSFMLGDALLVAPVVEQGAAFRKVTLPNGRWYSFWDDAVFEGGREIEVETPMERIPVFVKEGVILPLEEDGRRVLHYYVQNREAGEVFSQLYIDEGDGYNERREDKFTSRKVENVATLKWQKDGKYPLDEMVRVVVHGGNVLRARADGVELDWTAPYTEIPPFSNLRLELD
jgi:alpha-glucosidase